MVMDVLLHYCVIIVKSSCDLMQVSAYNDPTIGSYTNYDLSPNGISSGNRRCYGLVYLVYKNAGSPRARPREE